MTRARLPFLASYRPGGPPLTLAEKLALVDDLGELDGLLWERERLGRELDARLAPTAEERQAHAARRKVLVAQVIRERGHHG